MLQGVGLLLEHRATVGSPDLHECLRGPEVPLAGGGHNGEQQGPEQAVLLEIRTPNLVGVHEGLELAALCLRAVEELRLQEVELCLANGDVRPCSADVAEAGGLGRGRCSCVGWGGGAQAPPALRVGSPGGDLPVAVLERAREDPLAAHVAEVVN